MPTLSPETIQRWTELHTELSSQPRYAGKLAELFVGHVPEGYALQKERLLYIGKATGGPFNADNPSAQFFDCNGAAFWSLAHRLSAATDPSCEELGNIAWSNLCKIGTAFGNPDDRLAKAQYELAVESLQEEIQRVQPTLIICAAEGYQDHFFYDALGVTQGVDDGFQSSDVDGVPYYCRPRQAGWPPVLWMKHPQFRRTSYLEAVVAVSRNLLNLSA